MFIRNLYSFRSILFYLAYTFLFIAIYFALSIFVFTDSFYYASFANNIATERITQIIEINKKFQWLSYTIVPIILFLKWFILASVIYVGLFLFNQNIAFKNCFRVVQLAELAMLFAAIAKLIWFIFYPPQTLEDVQYFSPLAVTQLFNPNQIPKYWVYPLQQLNVFEVLYWLLIAGGIQAFTKKTFAQSLKITALSYGVAMLFWCIVIVFIQLQFS